MAAADILVLISAVVVLAVTAEMLGDRIGVPNFLFFILAGLLIGPSGLGLIHHQVFGEGLAVLVGLSIAIIIFHSGSGITREALRETFQETPRLVTVGVVITFLGASSATYLVMDVPRGLALLIGALLIATGTTVIEPILATVPVRHRLSSALEIEATVTEVTAGVLAVSVFHAVTVGEPEPIRLFVLFNWVLVVGVVVGAVVGAVAWFVLTKPEQAPQHAPDHATQLYLATAIVAFSLAEYVQREAGVAAVATAGIILGNADLPYEAEIVQFEEGFTTFIIAFVFVVLTSFVEPEWLASVGIEGLVVGLLVILVVRPLAVFVSTAGSALSTEEKLFLSAASPRGIIPAGVATLLALSIKDSNPETAVTLTGTVLLVIIVSSVVEGLFAGRIAERFDLTLDANLVVGAGRLGRSLADQYAERGERVVFVETDQDVLERARSAGFPVHHGDGTDEAVLRRAGADGATRIVAATGDDETNRAIAELARSAFDAETVLVRLNHRGNRDLFDDLDVELLTGSQLDLWALEHLTAESAPDWLAALTRTGGVGSISITEDLDETVAELDRSLPQRAFVVALSRDGETWIPEGSESVDAGDRLTLLGLSSDVETAADHLDEGRNVAVAEGQAADDVED